MKRLSIVASAIVLVVATACASEVIVETTPIVVTARSSDVRVWHDTQRDVTCWIVERGSTGGSHAVAISCLPDSQLR